jgi:tetratricopeptide (TPR) repeat protein
MAGLEHVDAILDSAIAQQQAGALETAEALYRQVLDAEPDNVDALNLLGLLLQEDGRLEEAIALLERAIVLDPDFPDAHANLARGLNLARRADDAHAAARRATDLDPDLAEGWQQLGLACLSLNQSQAALDAFHEAERLTPELIAPRLGVAQAAMRLLDHAAVIDALSEVLAEEPDNLEALSNMAIALVGTDRFEEGAAMARHAVALNPDNTSAKFALALSLFKLRDDIETLESICQSMLEIDPNNIDCLIMLGGARTWRGAFDEAKAIYHQILDLQPSHPDAKSLLAALRAESGEEDDISAYRTTLDDTAQLPLHRASAGHALARILERDGDYDGAFAADLEANQITAAEMAAGEKAKHMTQFQRYLSWAPTAFTPALFERFKPLGHRSDMPVFIVGMPRSGTTLVEQILSSHPEVFGGGERSDLEHIMARLAKGTSPSVPTEWDLTRIAAETEAHISALRAIAPGASRFVDKMPDNILFMGQIAMLFPNARFIVCRRDLRDICLSCFTTFFPLTLPWSNSLEDCGDRAAGTMALLDLWRRVLPARMIEVQYESLVADLESESRRLIDFLGLEWDPACLDYQQNKRAVSTASYMQVRQPIYDRSIGRWRRFEKHLGPLLEKLKGLVPED